MISSDTMSPAELAALLHFHAEAGVEWLLEDDPVDRFAEFEHAKAARGMAGSQAVQKTQSSAQSDTSRATPNRDTGNSPANRAPAAPAATPQMAIPDEQAIAEARFAAESARSLAELKSAMEAFSGCNLKNSARNMVFADGNPSSGIMVIGSMPNGDDDREGTPFSGRQGQMLERMLASIGLDRTSVLLTNVIPWRPPGNRPPSPRETDICRPFIERQIMLAEPRHLLVLGNFAGRFFFGGNDTIHHMRGEWRDIPVGGITVSALATLHPQDLISAPASKRLAWQDLLAFRARIRG
ncbi:uracil-DNA glycosylase [Pararhizobium sp. BT-229]|uniref:uracil-DNA glycosylase n=1 Tax=Pararhizobium sp. BT-229 TaxID=2986923 RepID=UPI0021F70969|nr:uracil-DNA glycosylase [Pararhizobium sp. BT-229]MCV9963488.1 uracil-DNA glycosylase [Pararhizobium sp. BT-229]